VVQLSWNNETSLANGSSKSNPKIISAGPTKNITAPIEGKFFTKSQPTEKSIKVGDVVKKGDTVAYIESMKVLNAITSDIEGTVVEITLNHGDDVEEDEVILKLS